MSMDFRNRLKGSVTQTLVKALLEDAGYRTIPLGVEEVIREVSVLSHPAYSNLELPEVLRKMPDFFVADEGISKAWLVEVKYRKVWNNHVRQKLGEQIFEQVKLWNPLFLTVFLGNSVRPGNDKPVHSIGVIKLTCKCGRMVFITPDEETHKDWSEVEWSDFLRFQDVFRNVGSKWEEQTLMKVLVTLRSLKCVDLFEE
jgi:hypothetical protein